MKNNIINFCIQRQKRNEQQMYKQILSEIEELRQEGYEYNIQGAAEIAKRILFATPYYLGESSTPIVKIAQEFEFKTYETTLKKDLLGQIFISGDTEQIYQTDKVIIVNNEADLFQKRFVVAHELAHYLFDYIGNSKYDEKGFTENYYKDHHETPEEKRANAFAAEILMPAKLFISTYLQARRNIDNRAFAIAYLSKYFKTPESSIEKRIGEVLG